MDAAQKSFQLQTQVRQNAEDFKNVLNDLYSWEKEIKDKEKEVQKSSVYVKKIDNMTLPIRSHIQGQDSQKVNNTMNTSVPASPLTNGSSLLSPSSDELETANHPLELKHKEANEIKDRGNEYVKMSNYQMAIKSYTSAIQLYPDDAVYYSNRALCYLKLERYDECIEDCERAIDIDRLAVKAYYRRMMANESLGNNMDALKDCTTVLMIEPKNSEAKRSLERINERLRKNVKSPNGPNFSPLRPNIVDILPIDKPAYKRSTKPLKRLAIADVVGPKDSKNYENLTISDEDIDKLFNSNCGHFEEIKGPINKENNSQTKTNNPKEIKEKKSEQIKDSSLPKELNEKRSEENNKIPVAEKIVEAKSQIIKNLDSNITLTENNTKLERPLPPAPTSTAQFYSNWKELLPQQKFEYLKSIPITHLCKILGDGFDSDTLTDILNTLHDFYLPQKDVKTAATLLEVSKNKQVSILSLLLSNEERKVLAEIINSLKETKNLDSGSAEQITKNFNIKCIL